MILSQFIYTSRPFGFSGPMLDDILTSARWLNTRDGITGALICRADMYMQLLDGPRGPRPGSYGVLLPGMIATVQQGAK